jgi:hypothetical protein
MADRDLTELLFDGRLNALAAWVLCLLFALSLVEGVLTGDLVWALFAAVTGALVVSPAVATRDYRSMPPWEVVLLAGLPVVGRSMATFRVTSTYATYLSIAALALLVAVNLHLFTTVEMNVAFAVLFVVVTTLATAGAWALVRWASDLYLGTALLLDPTISRDAIEKRLMWEFVGATVAGLGAGLLFEGYVRRRAWITARLPGGEPA